MPLPPNPLTGTPMGPLDGVVPPNPLMQQALSAAPPPAPQAPPQMPSRENYTKALGANKGMSDLLAGLVGAPQLSTKQVIDAMATAVGNGHMSAQQAASEISNMPQQPEQLRQWVQNHFIQNMEMGRRLTDMGQQLPPVMEG